jgi:prepilin-type N-terminal cleavage/methylation domain-containing protein
MTRRTNQSGFSMIEVLIAISLSGLLLLVLGNFVTNGIRSANQDYNQTVVLVNTKAAVETVARFVREARSVQSSNSQPDDHAPGAPGNLYSWSGSAGSGGTLILAIPSRDTSNNLIYIDGLHNNLYTDDVIFYLDAATHRLYKRVIANTAATGNKAVTTCPPAAATPSCPADSVIVEDVANLTTSYIDSNGATITTPSGTEAVNFTVTESKIIGPRTYTSSYTTTATLRNK